MAVTAKDFTGETMLGVHGPNATEKVAWFEDFLKGYHNDRSNTELCDIMNRQKSDKGSGWHTYTQFYNSLFAPRRNQDLNVFEVGLGTNNVDVESSMGTGGTPGASLRGWREFFPRARIYGADVDKRVLFREYRIETFYVDQTNPGAIKEMWSIVGDVEFDIMIDDGLHQYHASAALMQNSIHKLAKGGIYIVEDIVVQPDNIANYNKLLAATGKTAILVYLPSTQNAYDNCVCAIWN